MGFLELHRNNPLLDNWIDGFMWSLLFSYYYPYGLAARGDEVDKFISQFSLNGAKSNLCRPT
jgi:hypothetical protein